MVEANLLLASRHRYLPVAAAVVLAVVLAALTAWQYHPFEPARDAAVQTYDLSRAVSQLDASLSSNQPSSQVSRDYVLRLTAIVNRCTALRHDVSLAKANGSNVSLRALLARTDTLCADLTGLVVDSKARYVALLPLLSIDTSAKHYQMLPGIESVTRSNDLAKIAASLQSVRQLSPKADGFSSSALSTVGQLHKTARSSTGLRYLPSVSSAQAQLLGERTQYWATYGGISELKDELNAQVGQYCILLSFSPSSPMCSAIKDPR